MKRKLFFIPALALLLASCSSEEPVNNNEQKPEYAAATSYLNINIRPTNGMGTRADSYPMGGGTYEDGTPDENNVTRVRFYFFGAGDADNGGTPFAVRQNLNTEENDNFVDWYPNSSEIGGPNHEETVEKTLTATLGLTLADSDERPAQVIAIANPTDEILYYNNNTQGTGFSSNSMSLKQLLSVVANYRPYDYKNFVMSNSVYVENNKPVYTTELEDNNFQPTPAQAAEDDNVVTIYIERVLARVDFGIAFDEDVEIITGANGTLYKVGTYTLNDGTEGTNGNEVEEDDAIYVKFLGWNVTSTTGTSRLIKEVNPLWTNTAIMGSNSILWNTDNYHRSFWALNPADVDIEFGNFGQVEGVDGFPTFTPSGMVAKSLDIPTGSDFVTTYLQENANPITIGEDDEVIISAAAPTEPSKVIIAAQLVNKDGTPITICEWGYNKYTLDGLQKQIAKALPNLYYQEEGSDEWSQIEYDMITFTTEDPLGSDDRDKEYYVYAVIDEEAFDGTKWALKNGTDFEEFTTNDTNDTIEEQVNKYIRGIVNHAMIWNTGLTYYFFDIRHLAEEKEAPGYVGIVRNHLYRTTVTGLKGLGTPVYDPNKEIHPQNPNPGETVIEAKINILSWRLVTSSYEVGWQ